MELENPFNVEENMKKRVAKVDSNIIPRKRSYLSETGWTIFVLSDLLNTNEVYYVSSAAGNQFKYFRSLNRRLYNGSDVFCSENTINNSLYLSYITVSTARVIFQSEIHNLYRHLNSDNLIHVLQSLDYLGYLPMIGIDKTDLQYLEDDAIQEEYDVDQFWSLLARKLSCSDWFNCETSSNSKQLRLELLRLCPRIQNGYKILFELAQYKLMEDVILTKEGGYILRELFQYHSELYSIKIVNTICESIGTQWSPSEAKIEDFIMGVTGGNNIFDSLANIWQPTLWHINERKVIHQFAQDSPHTISGETNSYPIDVELYADQDSEGSTTTVNFTMETAPPSPDAPLVSITSLGIFAYPKIRCTGLFCCFAARAKFYYQNVFLGEATFDLSSDGIKAFCPVMSGGPNKTGLLVTCRIDEYINKNRDQLKVLLNQEHLDGSNSNETLRVLQSSLFYHSSIDHISVNDLQVDVKIRFFPLRTLSLYLLYKRSLANDIQFVTSFAFSLQQDVAEWLGTYLTNLWIQISKQKDRLFLESRSEVVDCKNLSNFQYKNPQHSSASCSSTTISSSHSGSIDILSYGTNLRSHQDLSPEMRNALLREVRSSPKRLYSASINDENGTNTCFIDPIVTGISPFPLISAWFKGVGRPSDTWCIHNILSELLCDELIAKHFTDILTLIQTCDNWIDTESLANLRDRFIQFINNNKLQSIGGLLFDWIRHIPKKEA
ncbi:hypothetical protein cand_026070 [Cryptosporidium andersoni]|uniref:Uncharacterized protein n=1 Tax=Cryptosporidium andersoni TaxID=117008 RepID=A0A1J4MB37_9CRYT|nr:hypothetical protein cand_026070 [Cryptosporidium andersoni]